MKIHRIAVENLNSLYGEHTVDLEEDLAGASLFLIQGPTGSGKSTLMDAISLVLFSETPRLRGLKSTDVAEEIMSRDTATCRAEVVFSKLSRANRRRETYRAAWYAWRKHKRAGEAVSDVERSLERREADGTWTTLIGGAEGRKVRQAAAAFSAVLEDFGLRDFTRSMLLAQGQFDAMLNADAEERANILERLTDTQRYREIGRRAAEINSAWSRKIEGIQAKLGGVEAVGKEEMTRLETLLQGAIEEERKAREALDEIQARITWRTTRSSLSARVAAAADAITAAEARHQTLAPARERLDRFDAARDALHLLKQITEAETRRRELTEQRAPLDGEIAGLEKEHRARQADVEAARGTLEKLKEALQAFRPVADAAEEALRTAGEARREVRRETMHIDQLEVQRKQVQGRLDDKIANARERLSLFQRTAEEPPANASSASLDLLMIEITGVLADAPEPATAVGDALLACVRPRRETLGQRLEELRSARELRTSLDEARQRIERRATIEGELTRLEEETGPARTRRDDAEKRVDALTLAQSYLTRRAELQAGEPCPLCGATEHPAAGHGGAELQADLAAAEGERAEAREAVQQLDLKKRSLEQERQEVASRLAQLGEAHREGQGDALEDALGDSFDPLGAIEVAWGSAAEALGVHVSTDADELSRLESLTQIEARWIDTLEGLAQEIRTAEAGVDPSELERLAGDLAGHGEALTGLKKKLAEAEAVESEALARLEAEWTSRMPAASLLSLGEDPFRRPRGLVEAWEARIGTADEALTSERTRLSTSEAALADGREKREKLDGSLSTTEVDIRRLEPQLATEMATLEVGDRETLAQLRIPAEEVPALRQRVGDARDALTRAEAAYAAADKALDDHLEAAPEDDADTSDAALADRREDAAREVEAAVEESRKARSARDFARQSRERQKQIQRELDGAKEAASVWRRLHDLIGTAEGRNFKKFAQGMNLRQLLVHANRHLSRLQDRYRLRVVPDPATRMPTLEFDIEDRWRPGTRRSLKTLSGGESFLTSLALALGLSDLRNSSMPIETLLLDEGFGTLDPETLDVALAALDQLQADGRQIGLISHVVGLDERIEAQVRVHPLGNGRSEVRTRVASI